MSPCLRRKSRQRVLREVHNMARSMHGLNPRPQEMYCRRSAVPAGLYLQGSPAAHVVAGLWVVSQLGCTSFCLCCTRACGSQRACLRSAGVPLVGLPGRGRAEGTGRWLG